MELFKSFVLRRLYFVLYSVPPFYQYGHLFVNVSGICTLAPGDFLTLNSPSNILEEGVRKGNVCIVLLLLKSTFSMFYV